MSRVNAIDPNSATGRAKELLALVSAKIGVTPNMMRGMANSPAVLESYLQMSAALEKGALRAPLREKIALAVAEANACDYCLAAHTAIGRGAGLNDQGIASARLGESTDRKEQAALEFSRALVKGRGEVSDAVFGRAKQQGFSDGEIGEIIANVALNLFTNYFNKAVGTIVDFPRVEPSSRAAA